ncbi:hypothetical protein [Streptomyces sp. KCTC 0041BP]|uniref:hypothetical protein n=1 Tax=Streptomyces sp. KCTC 0041BP TaxID=201500 RepID=UPI001FD77B0D|nr:hypothetical protein [Streptomyces sp. KCTC 0041BP]
MLAQQELLALLRRVVVLVELPVPESAGRLRDEDAQVGAVDPDAPGGEVREAGVRVVQELHTVRAGRLVHAPHPVAPT